MIFLLACGPVSAEVPGQIHYQGLLADEKGNPVNGNRTIEVRLFDASTGGTELYHETIGPVTVVNGIYSFAFGNNGTRLAAALTGLNNHLSVSVNGTEQIPRTKILAVPYALIAKESSDAQLLAPQVGGLQTQASALSANLTAVQTLTVAQGANLTAVQAQMTTLGANISVIETQSTALSANFSTIKSQLETLSGNLSPLFIKRLGDLVERSRVISLSGELAFGNSSTTRELTIANMGFDKLRVTGISYPEGFTGNWSGVVPASGSQSITVSFAPADLKAYSGNITILSDAVSGVAVIPVSGTGSRIISLSGNLAFGNVTLNSSNPSPPPGSLPLPLPTPSPTPAPQNNQRTLTIFNTGTMDLTVSGITYPYGFSGNWSGTIPPGGSQNVDVVFNPTVEKFFMGDLIVVSNASGGNGTTMVSGTASGTRIINLLGNMHFDGHVHNTVSRTLSITNNGTSALTVRGISYPSTYFSGNWTGTIAPNSSQDVTVTWIANEFDVSLSQINVISDATSGISNIPVKLFSWYMPYMPIQALPPGFSGNWSEAFAP